MFESNNRLNNMRNRRFWLWDRMSGGSVRFHLNDVKAMQARAYDDTVAIRTKYLQEIMLHAGRTCPYYQGQHRTTELEQFPVINKNIIRENFNSFLSEHSRPERDRLVSTSGSTGTPFKVLHNAQKSYRSTADNLYFYSLVGYQSGDPIYYFRFWSAFGKKTYVKQKMQNITPIEVFDLDDPFISNLLKKLGKEKCDVTFLGYSSGLARLCEYLDTNNPNYRARNVKAIVTIAESLDKPVRESLEKYFGVKAVSRYSNSENGIIAQERVGENCFIVNYASYHVEILSETNNEPLEGDGIGRIVVTDYFNKSMPMIRYDTGDLGSLDVQSGELVLKNIAGRGIDQLTDADGNRLKGNIVLVIHKYENVKQCQVIQKGRGDYVVKLNTNSKFDQERLLLNELRQYLGAKSSIEFSYVDRIPLLASGKMRVMVNEMAGN